LRHLAMVALNPRTLLSAFFGLKITTTAKTEGQ
jgi:hypothetical protein